MVETVIYGGELICFIVSHNVNDDVLMVLVIKFEGVEEPVDREGFRSDVEASASSSRTEVHSNTWSMNEIDLLT